MRKIIVAVCLLLLTVSFGQRALAQDEPKPADTAKLPEPPAHFYHLDFVVQELGAEGKPTNSRTYAVTVSTDPRWFTSIRINSRVPVPVGTSTNPQIQYENVGVSFDANQAREIGRLLAFDLKADVRTLAAPSGSDQPSAPVIRQNQWQSGVLIPIGKATVVFTSDSLDSKGGMQVLVTATALQ